MSRKMKSLLFSSLLVTVAAGAFIVVHGQTRTPGEMTQARVWVENRSPNEAVPVVVERIANVPAVHISGIDPQLVLPARAVRQQWEYRSLVAAIGPDMNAAMERAGADGWEAVGVLQAGPAGTTVLLKRPR